MTQEVVVALISIVFAAATGGVTNMVAIWMLFHPYRPPRIGRWRLGLLQGAVPKNQGRLAAAVGRTVGTRLLTEEDLARSFAEPAFRAAFDERLAAFLDAVLHRERGSLRELMPEAVRNEGEALLRELAAYGVARFQAYLASPSFPAGVAARADEMLAMVRDEPIGGLLTPARGAAIADAVEDWFRGAVETDDFRRTAEDYLARAAHRLLSPERTFEEILPLGLVGSVERGIQAYLPIAIERLGTLLEDPSTRARFESTLHDLFHRFLRDLKFHQRVVARLVVTQETLDRVLDTIEKEGAERMAEVLQDPAVQAAMAKSVNEAVVDFLRRPVRSVLGGPDDPGVREALATLAEWAVGMARDLATRAFLIEKLDQALERASARTWGDVVARIPAAKLADGLVEAARSPAAARLYQDITERLVTLLLERPIGVPARWLPADAPQRIEVGLGDPLWGWLQTQVPTVVQRIDVAHRVEQKVLEYPMPKLEELIKTVTERELKLIVRLGFVLGAVIGVAMVTVNWVAGRLMGG